MPATFITKEDYLPYIHEKRLNMILENNDGFLDVAEETAEAVIKDALFSRYDVDNIFATTDTSRPRNVLKWAINLTIYFIYERIPDKLVPDRVIKNYDETLTVLLDIEDGKKSVNLPVKVDAESGEVKTKFRWGSNANNRDIDSTNESGNDADGGWGWATAD